MLRFVVALVFVAGGIGLAVFGEYDDSPGGVLWGIVIAVGAVVWAAKRSRRRDEP